MPLAPASPALISSTYWAGTSGEYLARWCGSKPGSGLAFIHAGGTLHHRKLEAGEVLKVDSGCIVAFDPSVDYDIKFVGGFKNTLFGGEGLFFAHLTGPGRVWLQSPPPSRLADRIYKAAPQAGGRRKGEGSILDHAFGLGNLIDGT